MPNPYPAEFWGPSRDTRALVVRLGGYVNFTDDTNQPGIGSVDVTDGSHTVSPASEIDFVSGATVTDAGGGVAQVAITGGGTALTVTDGIVTVTDTAELDFTSGATITDAGAGVAQIAITGGASSLELSSFSFAYNTANLNTGIDTGIAAVTGKAVIALFATITTTFDGTNPFADIGVGVTGGGMGVNLAAFGSNPNLSTDDWAGGGAIGNTSGWVTDFIWTSTGSIELWVSQDGTKGGTAAGGTAGAATLYILQTT